MTGHTETIQTVALTAEMVINAFSMARQEFDEMVGKTANRFPSLRLVVGGHVAVMRSTAPRTKSVSQA
jgi:hypothetical protein